MRWTLVIITMLLAALTGCARGDGPAGSRPLVSFDRDVYALNKWGTVNETVLVTGSFAPPAAVAALQRVEVRMMTVDERGDEHPDMGDGYVTDENGKELYTPNYVSDPTVRPGGVELYVDCKGGMSEAMAQRFKAILREELSVLGTPVVVHNVGS